MAVNFGIPFGPVFNPDFGLSSWFFVDDFIASSISAAGTDAVWDDVSTSGTNVIATSEPFGAIELWSGDGAVGGEDAGIELEGAPISFNTSLDMLFGIRFKVDALTGSQLFFGLHTVGFDVGSGAAITGNHIGFIARDAASIEFSSADGTSQTISDTTDDLVAATYVTCAFKYSAVDGKLRYYVNGVLRGDHSIADDNVPADSTEMTLGLHNEFDGAGITATVDYIYIAGERN